MDVFLLWSFKFSGSGCVSGWSHVKKSLTECCVSRWVRRCSLDKEKAVAQERFLCHGAKIIIFRATIIKFYRGYSVCTRMCIVINWYWPCADIFMCNFVYLIILNNVWLWVRPNSFSFRLEELRGYSGRTRVSGGRDRQRGPTPSSIQKTESLEGLNLDLRGEVEQTRSSVERLDTEVSTLHHDVATLSQEVQPIVCGLATVLKFNNNFPTAAISQSGSHFL